jgi:hypothetical protein
MPAYIPMPEGLQVPEEQQFDLPVTFEVRDNMLYALAVDGMPVPKEKEEEGEEMEEEGGEMEEEGGEMDFMSAVESAMKKPQPK